MRHIRPSWFRRFADKHPLVADALPVLGITVCLCIGVAILLWISTAKLT